MNNTLSNCLVIFICWAFFGCAPQEKVDIAAEKEKVKTVVDQFEEFWETEDMNLLTNIMSHDATTVSYGSDINEIFVWMSVIKRFCCENVAGI